TACFSALPALNRGTRRFGTLIVAPVCGLRALRALRFEVLKVPKPTNETESPFLSDLVMPLMSESTAAAALVFVSPVSLAIFWMTSCLFMGPPGKSPETRGAVTAGGRLVTSRSARRLYVSAIEVSSGNQKCFTPLFSSSRVPALFRAQDRRQALPGRTPRRVRRRRRWARGLSRGAGVRRAKDIESSTATGRCRRGA